MPPKTNPFNETEASEEHQNHGIELDHGTWVSIWGAIEHSVISWPQGRFEDTILPNPFFDPSSPIAYSLYCIHGTADRSFAFYSLSTRLLTEQNHASNLLPKSIKKIHLLAFDGRYQGASIEDFARQVKYKIIRNRDKHVILAGHSRGGEVAAYFTQFIAEHIDVTVHGVLPICAPLYGSPLAMAPLSVISTSVAQMREDSEFLTKLRASITSSESSRKKYYFFAVERDAIVPTEHSIMKQDDSAIFILPHHGHLSILQSPELAGFVSDCLKQIVERPISHETLDHPIEDACLELEAELFALKKRYHLFSPTIKIQILSELKDYLWDMRHGYRGSLFPEAKTIGEFIRIYLSTTHETLGLPLNELLKQPLNPSVSGYFFDKTPPKSSVWIENLIEFYQSIPLPTGVEKPQSHWVLV